MRAPLYSDYIKHTVTDYLRYLLYAEISSLHSSLTSISVTSMWHYSLYNRERSALQNAQHLFSWECANLNRLRSLLFLFFLPSREYQSQFWAFNSLLPLVKQFNGIINRIKSIVYNSHFPGFPLNLWVYLNILNWKMEVLYILIYEEFKNIEPFYNILAQVLVKVDGIVEASVKSKS